METNALPLAAPRRHLPPVSTFLSDVVSLGVRSLKPAISALTLLCFYRFGMGLYLEFAVQQTSPLGYPDERARAAHLILTAAAYLPLLVLVYTPFLPLQDAILRGGRKSFLESVRHVLENMVPFCLSVIAQAIILLSPLFVMFFLAAAALSTVPEAPAEVLAGTLALLLLPACAWVGIAGLFMLFATPALVLDGMDPIRSLGFSVREVARHFWGILGRLIVGFGIVFVAVLFASFPASILAMTAVASGFDSPALKIARVLWTSLVTAAAFPFSVAVLMTIYRALAPIGGVTGSGGGGAGRGSGGAGGGSGGAGGDDGGGEPRPLPENPRPVDEPHKAETPYVFE